LKLRRTKLAKLDLQKATKILGQELTVEQLFVLKGQAMVTALESKSTKALRAFKAEAIRRRHWESVREADLLTLKIHFDRNTFHHLFFGSPFPAYRRRIVTEIGRSPDVESYVLGSGHVPCLDLASGTLDGSDSGLNPGKTAHRLLTV